MFSLVNTGLSFILILCFPFTNTVFCFVNNVFTFVSDWVYMYLRLGNTLVQLPTAFNVRHPDRMSQDSHDRQRRTLRESKNYSLTSDQDIKLSHQLFSFGGDKQKNLLTTETKLILFRRTNPSWERDSLKEHLKFDICTMYYVPELGEYSSP